jgi:hypothetical protein
MKLNAMQQMKPSHLRTVFYGLMNLTWKPIEQSQERAIDGTLIVQEGKKKSGRPITLYFQRGTRLD